MAKLENRYAVIKLSKMSTMQKMELHSFLLDVPVSALVSCVVVEKDWPMYDATVKAVLEYAEQTKKREPCKYCKGAGERLIVEGHDCWGESDNTYVTCPACKGTRFHDQKRYELVIKRDALDKELLK